MRPRLVALAAAGALALAIAGTWPLAAHLSSHVYSGARRGGPFAPAIRPDVYLTLWILAWDAHALTTAPASLFDANVFHPARGTLALSEHMLGAMPLYLPLALASGDPVLAHQATLLLSFAAAFLAALALVRDWTGSWPAAAVAGALFALCPFRAAHLGAIHIEGCYYLPLVPLCARRAAVEPEWRWPFLLGAVLVLQALHSYYLGYAAFAAAAVIAAVAVGAGRGAVRLIAPIAGAALVVALVSLPYLRAAQAGAIALPSRELVHLSSAAPGATGATPALVLALVTAPFWTRALREGVAPSWVAGLAAAAILAHVLALGPEVHLGGRSLAAPYAWLAQVVPGLDRARVPLRFNAVTAMALAALAGLGVAGALRAPVSLVVHSGAALAFVLFLHGLPAPVPLEPIDARATLPAAYRWLAAARPGPLLELPFHDFDLFPFEREHEARRMYRSVYHWHPLLGGYSGHTPPAYAAVSALARALPDPRALELLARATALRYILVHRAELPQDARSRWVARPRLVEGVREFGDDLLLTLHRPADPDLLPELRDPRPRSTTLLGNPIGPLADPERRAEVSLASKAPDTALSGVAFEVDVNVTNRSRAVWPALAPRGDRLVTVAYRWEGYDDAIVGESPSANRLPFDLGPGESVRVAVAVLAQGPPGARRLVIGVAQDGAWFGGTVSLPIRVEQRGAT